MKKMLFFTSLLLIIGAGCSVKSNKNPSLSAPLSVYKMEIIKSAENINKLTTSAKNPTDLKTLLTQANIKFQSQIENEHEKITLLDGVLTTANKEWNLYINDKKVGFTTLDKVSIQPNDKIVWQYLEIPN